MIKIATKEFVLKYIRKNVFFFDKENVNYIIFLKKYESTVTTLLLYIYIQEKFI